MGLVRLGLTTLLLSGCTVLNLDGFEEPNCQAIADEQGIHGNVLCSRALAQRDGLPDEETCLPYVCVAETGRCELRMEETCFQGDNDCDGLIDEGLQGQFDPATIAGLAERSPHVMSTELTSLSVAASTSAVTVTYTDEEDDAWAFDIGDSEPDDFQYGHNEQNQPWPASGETLLANSCWRQRYPGAGTGMTGAPEFDSTQCSFAAIAADRVQGVGLVAAINGTGGCSDGQLRVGYTSGQERDIFQVNGPFERSNSFLGVGLTSDGTCTATEPDACQAAVDRTKLETCSPGCDPMTEVCIEGTCYASDGCSSDADCPASGRCLCDRCVSDAWFDRAQACGVTGLNIAAAVTANEGPTEREGQEDLRGLVAFTGGSRDFDCGFERDVAILGAVQFKSAGGSTLGYVTTTNEGQPQVIGRTRSTAAPAIYGLRDQYVVTYPTSDSDGLAMHVIDGLPEFVENVDYAAGGTFSTAVCETVEGPTLECPTGGEAPRAVCGLTDCGSDVGACVSGARSCVLGEGVCDGMIAPDEEMCANDVDEDCDGIVDEDPAGRPCLTSCVPSAEVCNANDDDCDGVVDEDTGGAVCGEGTVGGDSACVRGTEVCRGGRLLCEGAVLPSRDAVGNGLEYAGSVVATADFPYGAGIDDDCDGRTDEGSAVMDCESDGTLEFCNGRDNDGDCMIDESPRLQAEDFLTTPITERPMEVVRQCIQEPGFPELPATVVEGGLGFGTMDDIAIAGTTFARGNEIAIGVVWRETAEGEDPMQRIGFRVLRFETDCRCLVPSGVECGDELCSESTISAVRYLGATDPVEVTTAPGQYGAPHVSYQPRGVIVRGSERSGRVVTRDGGYVVVYAQTQRSADGINRRAIMTRTLAEHDGLPLNAECTEDCSVNITVTGIGGDMRGVPDVRFPRAYFDQVLQETRFFYYDARNREFIAYPAFSEESCGGG